MSRNKRKIVVLLTDILGMDVKRFDLREKSVNTLSHMAYISVHLANFPSLTDLHLLLLIILYSCLGRGKV